MTTAALVLAALALLAAWLAYLPTPIRKGVTRMTKTDQRAAERLLKRAVEVAIADLRNASSTDYAALYERNLDRFHVAVQAATLFVTETRPAT